MKIQLHIPTYDKRFRKNLGRSVPEGARDTWYRMKARCGNPNNQDYGRYGGRGIKIEWRNFDHFWADMGEDWKKGLEIDRRDNDGNYSAANCRWATREEQMNNTRRCLFIEYRGERLTLKQWATRLGLNYQTIASRVYEGKWEPLEAITTPIRKAKYV